MVFSLSWQCLRLYPDFDGDRSDGALERSTPAADELLEGFERLRHSSGFGNFRAMDEHAVLETLGGLRTITHRGYITGGCAARNFRCGVHPGPGVQIGGSGFSWPF